MGCGCEVASPRFRGRISHRVYHWILYGDDHTSVEIDWVPGTQYSTPWSRTSRPRMKGSAGQRYWLIDDRRELPMARRLWPRENGAQVYAAFVVTGNAKGLDVPETNAKRSP